MKRALSIAEVAEALSISRPTVYRLLERGELKAFHVARRRLVSVEELDRFIAEREQDAA